MAGTCGKCGAPIAAHDPEKLCVRCLMDSALEPDVEVEAPDRAQSASPLDFGDYDLLSELGRGGQGVVYRARQKRLNRLVALKCIPVGLFTSPERLKRF